MAKSEITWQETKELAAAIIKRVAADRNPEELWRLYQEMEPKFFAHWLHGFLCASFKVIELPTVNISGFISNVLRELRDNQHKDGLPILGKG